MLLYYDYILMQWHKMILKRNLPTLVISSLIFTFAAACFLIELPLHLWAYFTTLS